MKLTSIASAVLSAAVLINSGALLAADAGTIVAGNVVEGTLTQVTATSIEVDRTHRLKFEPKKAECFDFRGDRMTCETLVGIGYADRARVTVAAGVVTRVDIIELQQ